METTGQDQMTCWTEGVAGNYDITTWNTEGSYTEPHKYLQESLGPFPTLRIWFCIILLRLQDILFPVSPSSLILTMCSLPGKKEHPLSKWGSNHLIRVAGIK